MTERPYSETIGSCSACGQELEIDDPRGTVTVETVHEGPPRFDTPVLVCHICIERIDEWFGTRDNRMSYSDIAEQANEGLPTEDNHD